MENIITINGQEYEIRYASKYVTFNEAKELESDGWVIPSFEEWDVMRRQYNFQGGFFSVDGNTITLPHTGFTVNRGTKYYDYWCNNGDYAFNPSCCGGTTFSRMEHEWHASLVLIKKK